MTAKSSFRIREPPSFYRARAAAKPLFRNGELYLQFAQRHTSLHDLGSRPSDRAVGASKRLMFLLLDQGGGPRRVDFPDSPEAYRNGTHVGRKNRRCQEKGLLR